MPSNIIGDLFDDSRRIDRSIEKVISYSNESKLLAEITEYVVTGGLESAFKDLLEKMSLAMSGPGNDSGGGGHEIGVWVSGFYGSGKSSFTKYLGFALDQNKTLEGKSFLSHLQDRLCTNATKALFTKVSKILNPHVVFLDLASEMHAGGEMQDVSSVLRNKVLRDCGYSNDIKVAELELMLEKDGKFEEFKEAAKKDLKGTSWEDVHNMPLISNTVCDRLARQFYPNIWQNKGEFANVRITSTTNERIRVEEIVALVKRKSGKNNILFIVDEVGQYVAARPELIINLDGFSRNLKEVGGGTVWLFATAQQTLTEDNRSATLNSPDLYKLKDRFPITVHLEATDIKEICHKRLLTKSTAGKADLSKLFQDNGAALRHATQLLNAQHYDSPLDSAQFLELYPFLPAHFEILLQLLGKLARRTGGLGLRSAIKVLQDVLIDKSISKGGTGSLADQSLGALATTVTFYDSLDREIQTSFSQVADGVKRVIERFGHRDEPFIAVAKTIAILQILENLPATTQNIAALMQPEVQSSSLKEVVSKILTELVKSDSMVPLGEKEGQYSFLSRAAIQLQEVLEKLDVKTAEKRARVHETIKKIFDPLPKVMVENTLGVTAGLKATQSGGSPASLDGEKQILQWLVDLVEPGQYETICEQKVQASRLPKEENVLFVQGRIHPEMEEAALTAARCKRFLDERRASNDADVKDFIKTVEQKLDRSTNDLNRLIREELLKGSFIARGIREPVTKTHQQFDKAAKEFLGQIAVKVYDRYAEAAYNAEGSLAEKFLKASLNLQDAATDPLGLLHKVAGKPMVNLSHRALTTIRDFLSREGGEVEGRVILDHFSEPPFGWSKDTTRYLIAGLLTGGELKMRISGADHSIRDDDTLKALATNKAIGPIGIQLRETKPDPEDLLRASERLKELVGEDVLPLEEDIGKIAKRHLPELQLKYASLANILSGLVLLDPKHALRSENLALDIAAVLQGDGTDAINRFGKVDSPIFNSLVWARKITKAFDIGLKDTLTRIVTAEKEWGDLPEEPATTNHHALAANLLNEVKALLAEDEFHQDPTKFQAIATKLESELKASKQALIEIHNTNAKADLQSTMHQHGCKELAEEDHAKIQEVAKRAEISEADAGKPASELVKVLLKAGKVPGDVSQLVRKLIKEAEDRKVVKITIPKIDHEISTPAYFTRKDEVTQLKAEIERLHEQMDGTKAIRIVWKTKRTEEGSL